MFIYDRSKDPHASLDTNPPLRSAETEAHQREASGPGLYPRAQVTRLIMDTAARDQEEEAASLTPADMARLRDDATRRLSEWEREEGGAALPAAATPVRAPAACAYCEESAA